MARASRGGQTTLVLPDEPIRVQVVPTPKPADDVWQRRGRVILASMLIALVVLAGLWGIYVAPTTPAVETRDGLQVALTFPNYLAVGDEGAIDVTVTNLTGGPVTGTLALAFSPLPPVHLLEESEAVIALENFPPSAGRSARVRFQAALTPYPINSGRIDFTPLATLDGQALAAFTTRSTAIAPFPYLRVLTTGAFGVSALAGLFWEQIKKRLFPSQ